MALIKEFEGFRDEPYTDPTGNPTVGIGHLCDDDACCDVPYDFPLGDEDATSLLQSDLKVIPHAHSIPAPSKKC